MKNTFLIIFLVCFFTACNHQKLTNKETVTQYYNARNAIDFNKVKPLVSDSITIISGDFVMPYNNESFYEVFKWDSVFKPSYKIVELQEKNTQIIAYVTLNSERNTFLKTRDMTCQYEISFNSGKISKIEELDCKNVNWKVWEKERNSLVNWTKRNQPELDGFINDMTMNGAINYLKAIELYEDDKDVMKP